MLDGNTAALRKHEAEQDAADVHYATAVQALKPRAREELIEELLDGKKIGEVWLRTIIGQELNSNYWAFIHDLAERFSGLESLDEYGCVEFKNNLIRRLRDVIGFYLDNHNPQMIERRAECLAEDDSHD